MSKLLNASFLAALMISGLAVGFFGGLQLFTPAADSKPDNSGHALVGRTQVYRKLPIPLSSYTIDMHLKSEPPRKTGRTKKNFPPTPIRLPNMRVEQYENGYRVWAKAANLRWRGGKPTNWNRLTISVDAALGKIIVFLNGKRVAEGPHVAAEDFLFIGSAGNIRHWRGNIRDLQVTDRAILLDNFDPTKQYYFADARVIIDQKVLAQAKKK